MTETHTVVLQVAELREVTVEGEHVREAVGEAIKRTSTDLDDGERITNVAAAFKGEPGDAHFEVSDSPVRHGGPFEHMMEEADD